MMAGLVGGASRPWPYLPASPWKPVCSLVHLSPPRVCSPSLEGLAQGRTAWQAALGTCRQEAARATPETRGRAAVQGHSGYPPQDRGPPLPSVSSSLKLANEDKEQKLVLLEEARVAVGKEARELRAGLQEVERSRLEARRELQELRRQVPHPPPPSPHSSPHRHSLCA